LAVFGSRNNYWSPLIKSKKMKSIFVIAFLLVAHYSFSQSAVEKMDAYLQAANEAGIFNGSVSVSQNGNVILSKGFGWRDAEAKAYADAKTVHQIGSVTKQFTAAVILRLAEQGRLRLVDTVSRYIPQFPHAGKYTIEQLLTHTSGLYSYTNDDEFMDKEVEKPINLQKLIAMVKDKPLDFEPGSKFSYSNTGYSLLGYIIEKVTGKPYEAVVRQQIFQPLQMSTAGFDFRGLKNQHKAVGYSNLSDGKGTKAMIVDSSVSFSAGAIYASVEDINKWNNAIGSEKLLKKSSWDNMFTPRMKKYGLGWVIDSLDGQLVVAHSGGIHGFLSYNRVWPGQKTSIIALANTETSQPGKVTNDLAAILLNKPYKLPEKLNEVKLNETLLKQYEGVYELAPTFSITVRVVAGQLKAQATGQPEFELFAKNEKEFFLKVVDAQVEFVKNEKGEVEKLILHQNGQHLPGIKKN
jgi:CubicO group peptidase (beta-lactamase class C family)